MRALHCLSLLGALLWAQGPGRPPFRHVGPREGLRATWVNQVDQDLEGRYWVATDAGLFVGDGESFRSMTGKVFARGVSELALGRGGRVWMATPQGMAYVEQGQVHEATELPKGEFGHLRQDAKGRIWVICNGQPLVSEDARTFGTLPDWPPERRVRSLHAHPGDPVALATREALWVQSAAGGWSSQPLPRPRMDVVALACAADGSWWAHNAFDLWWKPSLEAPWRLQTLPLGRIRLSGMRRCQDGRVWLATEGGPVGLWGREAPRILPPNPGVPYTGLRSVFIDREQNHVLGASGLYLTPGLPRVSQYGREEGLMGSVWALRRDLKGHLWAATQGGILRAEASGWRNVVPDRYVTRLAVAPDGSIWGGGGTLRGAVLRIDPVTLRCETLLCPEGPGVSFQGGFGFLEGAVWVATRDQGLWTLRPGAGGWVWKLEEVPRVGPADRGQRVFLQDRQGRLWSGSRRSLHGRWNGAWHRVQGTFDESPTLLLQVGKELWVSYGGQVRFRRFDMGPENPRAVGSWDGIPDTGGMALFSALAQGETLWLGTNQGLFRASVGSTQFRHFTLADGLPGDDCNGEGLHWDPEGHLWVATSTGLARLENPLAERPPLLAPIILSVWQEGKELTPLATLTIPPLSRGMEVLFRCPGHTLAGRLRYQALLEGRDATWGDLPGPRFALSGLAPGRTNLYLRALQEDGTPSEVRRLPLDIQPAWWQRGWVRVGMGVLLVGLVVGLVHQRTRVLRRRNARLTALVDAKTQDLLQALADLAQASQAKSDFLAGMSHELRTPLSSILLYGEVIRDRAQELEDPTLLEDAERVQTAGRHLLAMLNGVLDLSKIEAGRMELELVDTDLEPLLQEVKDTFAVQVRQRRNRLTTTFGEDLGRLCTDATRLRQILLNLVGNAAKFTEGGTIEVAAWRKSGGVVFEVRDTGIGMDPAFLQRIFRPYEQAEGAATFQRYGGTGLGLSLCHELARLMGGTLSAESVQGKGSTFRLELPDSPTTTSR